VQIKPAAAQNQRTVIPGPPHDRGILKQFDPRVEGEIFSPGGKTLREQSVVRHFQVQTDMTLPPSPTGQGIGQRQIRVVPAGETRHKAGKVHVQIREETLFPKTIEEVQKKGIPFCIMNAYLKFETRNPKQIPLTKIRMTEKSFPKLTPFRRRDPRPYVFKFDIGRSMLDIS
jgi:hypothetical protein